MRFNEKFYPLICLVFGLTIIAAGIFTLAAGRVVLAVACYIGGAVAIMQGLARGVSAFARKKTLSKGAFSSLVASSLFNVLAGIGILLIPLLKMVPVYIVFTAYIFVNALIKLIDYDIDRRDGVPGRIKEFMLFMFFLVFGVLMVFVPGMGETGFLIVAGIYCILYGVFLLWDFAFQCLPQSIRRRFDYKMSLPMPLLLSSLRPFVRLKARQREDILSPEKTRAELKPYFPQGKETDVPPDMEVMIHVSSRGLGIMGHTDVCFEGEVISYGSYDLTSTTLFGGVGDGIFVVGRREPYIRFYVTATPREIYGYGFRLNEEQKQAVREEIALLKSMAYPWETPLQQVLRHEPYAPGESVQDWGSKMWNCTGSDFFKFRSGKLKTYFVLTSNCVMMTDRIVRRACTDITAPRNVNTPGGYYDYLEHLLAMSNSPVFCRMEYNRISTAGWKYVPRAAYSDPSLEVMSETEANRRAAEKQGKKNDRKRRRKDKHINAETQSAEIQIKLKGNAEQNEQV